jgi:hypothetical protein
MTMAIAGTAVRRAADAMLRALGGEQVILLLPLPSAPSDPGSQLGLQDPGVQEVPISPVVSRQLPAPASGPRMRVELLLSASAVAKAVDSLGASSPQALFDSALGIQYGDDLLHIESVTTDYFAATVYLYRVVAVE